MESTVIDAYIGAQREDVQPMLHTLRGIIKAAAPNASEKISWGMPTFWQKKNIIHFAAFQRHVGLYPGSEAIAAFAERLTPYKTSKGAIQLPCGQPIDEKLVRDIVLWQIEHIAGAAK